MANPYFIDRGPNPLEGITRSAMGLAEIKQRGDIASQDAALRSRQLGIADVANELARQKVGFEFGPGGTETKKLDIMGRNAATAETAAQTDAAKLPASVKPFNMSNFTRISSQMKMQGIPVEDISAMNDLRTWASDANMNRGDVAHAFSQSWPELQKRTTEDLYNTVNRLTDKAANLPENDPQRQKIMKQIDTITAFQDRIANVPAEQVKQMFFPDIYEEERTSKAALQEARLGSQEALLTDRIASAEKVAQARIDAANTAGELRATTAKEVAQARLDAARTVAEIRNQKGPTEADKRANANLIATAETLILSNKSKPEVGAKVDEFNQYAEKPYAYTWTKNSVMPGGEWAKTSLPKNSKGKQITAKDVYEYAAEKGRTFEEVLQEVLTASTQGKK